MSCRAEEAAQDLGGVPVVPRPSITSWSLVMAWLAAVTRMPSHQASNVVETATTATITKIGKRLARDLGMMSLD